MQNPYRPSTFSIVAHDPETDEWGIAVASKFLAVGAVVPWARANVGAVATQSYANTTFGPAGLALLEQGYSAQATMNGLLAADTGREQRQIGIVDAQGTAATFTGHECYSWAGGRTGRHCAAQGNILTGPDVVDRIIETFEGEIGPLSNRLLLALAAGQHAGGDSRGQQSAALLVVRRGGGYGGLNDRSVDLRVDDHPEPIVELQRLLCLHKLYMFDTRTEDVLIIDEEIQKQIVAILHASGRTTLKSSSTYEGAVQDAFRELCAVENLEGRWREGKEVDEVVLAYLQDKYASA